MAEANEFDSVVTDDGVLSSIFGWLPAKDVAGLLVVNKRWSRVALEGTLHTPLPDGVASALSATRRAQEPPLEGGQPPMSRFKAHCGLCVFNLLIDPYFNMRPPRFPIDPFTESPWVVTRKMGCVESHAAVYPDNQLAGTLSEVHGLRLVAPPWSSRFQNPDDNVHRVIGPQQGHGLMEWTQVLDLTKALSERGFSNDAMEAILDACPPFRLSVWMAFRGPRETRVEVAFHTTGRVLPPYNTPQMDAYTKGALFSKTFAVPSTSIDVWEQHSWVLRDYPKGVRRVVVSLSTAPAPPADQALETGIAFFGSPCLLVVAGDSSTKSRERLADAPLALGSF